MDLKVSLGRAPGRRWKVVWTGDGCHARRVPRARDLHHAGVRTGAGEPRMRAGEGLPGWRCPSPSPVRPPRFARGLP